MTQCNAMIILNIPMMTTIINHLQDQVFLQTEVNNIDHGCSCVSVLYRKTSRHSLYFKSVAINYVL